ILGIIGLDNLLTTSAQTTIGGTTAFAPTDFYTFYDEGALLSAGVNGTISGSPNECLAIVGVSNHLPAAVNLFASQFGLSTPAITTEYATTSSNCNPGPTCNPGFTQNL